MSNLSSKTRYIQEQSSITYMKPIYNIDDNIVINNVN
jgi:hypothetical protein